tara:strand:+ start:585 stop:1022 length:438 start_codon:yes stop_codon:yes gene_type:complete
MELQSLSGLETIEDGKSFNFLELTDDLLVIDFWHVECPFCIPALGKFLTLSEKHKATGAFNIKFITCSLNVGEHSKEESLTLIWDDTKTLNLFAHDKQKIKDFWKIKTVPHCVVLKRNAETWDVLFSDSPNKSDLGAFLDNLLEF